MFDLSQGDSATQDDDFARGGLLNKVGYSFINDVSHMNAFSHTPEGN